MQALKKRKNTRMIGLIDIINSNTQNSNFKLYIYIIIEENI